MVTSSLPEPNHHAAAQSQELAAWIGKKISTAGGKLSFADFMQAALYTPMLGYYTNNQVKFGVAGDFITAPEITALFSQCIAIQCMQVFSQLTVSPSIIEFGAGTGIMAADILLYLEKENCLPDYYYIIEISPSLKLRQQATLQRQCPHLFKKVIWLEQLPAQINGVVLANEVLDAMPVEQFIKVGEQYKQRFVIEENKHFLFFDDQIENAELVRALHGLTDAGIHFSDTYCSEINLHLGSWLTDIEQSLQQGVILLIDYGYPRKEYYHPQRSAGTLQCHYRHRVHNDPLTFVGLQDITAHVDFTAVAAAAINAGLQVLGFSWQSVFLLNNGLTDLMDKKSPATMRSIKQSQRIKQLILPSEMGELFKVLALGKNMDINLQGFATQDMRYQL